MMNTITKQNLKNYFPIIQEKDSIYQTIMNNATLTNYWHQWTDARREEFLNWCSGAKGVKLLYDSFFKEVMNPEYAPERLNALLSVLLQKNVRVLKVLPTDSTRIANEQSLVIMDIVVELEGGGVADVEVQKCGYAFPGQRAACYSADLLLRQYKRVRDELGNSFQYKDIQPVYTIILIENSSSPFTNMPEHYVHRIQPTSDTGIDVDLLQTIFFIPLDIFKKKYHNKGIENELDAWLAFLSLDEPEDIVKLITTYPKFTPMYETIYQMCINLERMMSMYSKELEILDKNTVNYMIDEMQNKINEHNKTIHEQEVTIKEQGDTIKEQGDTIKEQGDTIKEQNDIIKSKDAELEDLRKELQQLKMQTTNQ